MKFKSGAIGAVIFALLSSPGVSNATNGMFLIGFGAKSRSMGGVGIGYTQDSLGNAMNPAGITAIGEEAMRIDADFMVFRPILIYRTWPASVCGL